MKKKLTVEKLILLYKKYSIVPETTAVTTERDFRLYFENMKKFNEKESYTCSYSSTVQGALKNA